MVWTGGQVTLEAKTSTVRVRVGEGGGCTFKLRGSHLRYSALGISLTLSQYEVKRQVNVEGVILYFLMISPVLGPLGSYHMATSRVILIMAQSFGRHRLRKYS